MRIKVYILTFLVTALIAGPLAPQARAFAQRQEPPSREDLFEMSLEELMDVRIDTVYGASRYEQKVIEAPSSITIITADEIRLYGHRTLADILRSVRGFYTNYDRNYHYLGVRGFSRPGDYNARVVFLIDGHQITENVGDSNPIMMDEVGGSRDSDRATATPSGNTSTSWTRLAAASSHSSRK